MRERKLRSAAESLARMKGSAMSCIIYYTRLEWKARAKTQIPIAFLLLLSIHILYKIGMESKSKNANSFCVFALAFHSYIIQDWNGKQEQKRNRNLLLASLRAKTSMESDDLASYRTWLRNRCPV